MLKILSSAAVTIGALMGLEVTETGDCKLNNKCNSMEKKFHQLIFLLLSECLILLHSE